MNNQIINIENNQHLTYLEDMYITFHQIINEIIFMINYSKSMGL